MSREDGGPAFPVSTRADCSGGYGHQDGEATFQFGGMTLRDYFAAEAMQGLIATLPNWSADSIATKSYEQADAMLAARKENTR